MQSKWCDVKLTAVIVCVDYADLLQYTLGYNRHHYTHAYVITTPKDKETIAVAESRNASVFKTNVFYENGANFNKFAAIEQCLDNIGRDRGWIALVDADVLWPISIDSQWVLEAGKLYTPLRHNHFEFNGSIPDESEWQSYKPHGWEKEFSGHTQIFHSSDPVLGQPPWHETNWKHAGGGDSMFQAKWAEQNKVRPPWKCLHLGVPGQWTGRVTPNVNTNETPQEATDRRKALQDYMSTRRRTGNYNHEKLQ